MTELYQSAGAGVPKPSSQGGNGVTQMHGRVNPHQKAGSVEPETGKQLFLPTTMKASIGQRKALNTQNQQHRAHSYGGQAPVSP